MPAAAESPAAERLATALAAAEARAERLETARWAAQQAAARELADERAVRRALEADREHLAAITGSRAYRVIRGLWALRVALAPPGTRREAALRAVLGRVVPATPAAAPNPPPAPPASAPPPAAAPVVTQAPRLLTPRAFRVCFVSPDATFVSHRYRVDHYARYLAAVGVDARVVELRDLAATVATIPLHDVVVVFRLAMEGRLEELYARCRRAGVPVVYDVDDLVFDPDVVTPAHVDSLRFLAPADLAAYLDRIPAYRRALLEADACTVSSAALAARCRALGRPAAVLPNGPAGNGSAAPARPTGAATVRLGYLAGTGTHQRDFAVAVPALARVLGACREVELVVVGALVLEEFPELAPFASRIERRPLVPAERVADELARLDVNLAPLEIGNPFCEAKSELKWVEAAAAGVPTVASATAGFAAAIAEGETGFLARDVDQWERALRRLVGDAPLRRRVGAAARRAVAARYAPAALGAAARSAYADVLRAVRAARGCEAHALAVTVVVDAYHPGRPGLARAVVLGGALARRGHEVRLVVDAPAPLAEASTAALRAEGLLRDVRAAGPAAELVACDALLATSRDTAATVARHQRRAAAAFQLVHDEGGPGPAAQVPEVRWGGEANDLPLFLDTALYDGSPEREGRDWIVAHVRPEDALGTNGLLFAALERLAGAGRLGGCQVVLVGSGPGASHHLPFPHVDLGRRPPAELPLVYRRAAVGVVLAGGYASAAGLEMMACGCPVVDVDAPTGRAVYGGRATLAARDPAAIAGAIGRLLADPARAHALAADGRAFARACPDVAAVAARLEARLVRALDG